MFKKDDVSQVSDGAQKQAARLVFLNLLDLGDDVVSGLCSPGSRCMVILTFTLAPVNPSGETCGFPY